MAGPTVCHHHECLFYSSIFSSFFLLASFSENENKIAIVNFSEMSDSYGWDRLR